MKKVLGLDLGTTSIGWALVNEAENENEKSSIIKMGVRLVSLDNFTNAAGKDIKAKKEDVFASGMSLSTRAARRNAKSARVNLQRYKMRREQLIKLMAEAGWIDDTTPLCEDGPDTTYQTLKLRAKAAEEEISLSEIARVLLMINKKRGYKSSRKLNTSDEGVAIDGMDVAMQLYEKNITPGEYVLQLYKQGKPHVYVPQFYPSDLREEFIRVWNKQQEFYPELTGELLQQVINREEKATFAILKPVLNLVGIKRTGKQAEQKHENYKWRAQALSEKVDNEVLAIVLGRINADINRSSGYLGAISDRSKELVFKKQTVGQYLWKVIEKNNHTSLKRRTFFREDYLAEFDQIWSVQSQFHAEEMPVSLQRKIRNNCVFFQRPLKSQKGKLDFCTLESTDCTINVNGVEKKFKKGLRVCPKSSPIFQEFRIWQYLNNLEVTDKETFVVRKLDADEREKLYKELSMRVKLSSRDVLKCLNLKATRFDINFDEIPGNATRAALYKAYLTIVAASGHEEIDEKKTPVDLIETVVRQVFEAIGINTAILDFNPELEGHAFDQQASYKLWHLLYSGEDKNLKEHISALCGFNDPEFAKILARVSFPDEYGNLSAKAIRNILPYMKQGMNYAEAAEAAGYRHSARSLTKEERDSRELHDSLPVYKSGTLRNPVVDKVLAQMTNVVNSIIGQYGKPDEVRVEMAREMKHSAKERQAMSDAISKNTKNTERIRELLQNSPFNIAHPTRNHILRWRLYEELQANGFKTLYSNTYISRDAVFEDKFDIEHIIPQARLFDDSFSNKTLELRSVNQVKGAETAYDYMAAKCSEEDLAQYEARVNELFRSGSISKAKRNRLLMKAEDIPQDFIQRDLRETQYITRKATEMLENVVRTVVATTGSITDYLREEWQLVDVMKELNLPLYEHLGMVREDTNRNGNIVKRIEDWSKRSDNRHHAMDALTVAFTKRSFIQYLNTLNSHPELKRSNNIVSPLPLNELRAEAKKHLSVILISERISKKVSTVHFNPKTNQKHQTPRGALHGETYYGCIQKNGETIFTARKDVAPGLNIGAIVDDKIRGILMARLAAFGNDDKKAFVNLDENPIWLNKEKGIAIKKVTIKNGKTSDPLALHVKRDHFGRVIKDSNGLMIPADYVAPDGNHHIAFYKDAKGKLHEHVVTFFEAVERKRQGLSVVDTLYNSAEGWSYLFSLQRGEYVIFPDAEHVFNPSEMDLKDKDSFSLISPHLFLVQKLSAGDYNFRHHLDPTTNVDNRLKGISWLRFRSVSALEGMVKVRLDILGNIVEAEEVHL